MNRLTDILKIVLIALFVHLLFRGCPHDGGSTTADTLTVTRTEYHDTVIYQPVLTASTMTEKVVTVHYVTDTVHLPGDTITMEVPVEQKRYDDSLYTAYVSGYRPQLDSIRLHLPSTHRDNNHPAHSPSTPEHRHTDRCRLRHHQSQARHLPGHRCPVATVAEVTTPPQKEIPLCGGFFCAFSLKYVKYYIKNNN